MPKKTGTMKAWIHKLKWRWERSRARSVVYSYSECAMEYTPGHQRAMEHLYMIEQYGIEKGWISEYTIKRRGKR